MIRTIKVEARSLDQAMDKALEKATDGLDYNPEEINLKFIGLHRFGSEYRGFDFSYEFTAEMDADYSEKYDPETGDWK